MATEQLVYAGHLVQHTCWCGIRHAIPSELDQHVRQSESNSAFCPLGHEWVVGESDVTKERRQRKEAERQAEATKQLLDHETRSHAATRGHLTRQKKRTAAGVCPVKGCRRHFKNLEAHMREKHPSAVEAAKKA